MKDSQLYSPKEIGRALGVSQASIKRWVDNGKIGCIKTSGGHRKIPMHSLIEYLRQNNLSLAHPEALKIPSTTGRIKSKKNQAEAAMLDGFRNCDEHKIRGIIYDLFLAGMPLTKIFDELLAPSLHQLGCDWESGAVDVFQERRTIQICMRAIYGFESFWSPPEKNAPIALAGTLTDDHYTIPVLMAETYLRSLGWRTEFLGNNLPIDSYIKAIDMFNPEILVISMSAHNDREKTLTDLQTLEQEATQRKCRLVLGGRTVPLLAPELLKKSLFLCSISEMEKHFKR